jgi:hypothetical protein
LSNEIKKIVKKIQFKTDKTIEEIAKDIGYTRAYFTNQINIGTNKTLKSLLEKYLLNYEQIVLPEYKTQEPLINQFNEDPAVYNMVLPMGDLRLTVKDHIDFLKDTIKKAEEREQKLLMLLEKDISIIKSNSETIQADLEVLTGIVRSDDEVLLKGTDRILGREEGASSTEAYIGERAFLDSDKVSHTTDSKGKKGSSGKGRQQRKD